LTDFCLLLCKKPDHFLADIDECNQPNDRSPCQYQCHNTVGGYRCSCPPGYELSPLTNLCSGKVVLFVRRSCRITCAESKLPCPQGARFADSVQYLSVSIPPPSSASGRNIILRVVDWQQASGLVSDGGRPPSLPVWGVGLFLRKTQQANCHFQLLDKAPNTPVQHRSEDGMVYLTPDWHSPDLQTSLGDQRYFSAVVDQTRSDTFTNKLFYLFFRVSCFSGDPVATGRQDFDVFPVGEQKLEDNSRLIFQHSFYVYISVSKYPF
uniref:EGF-like domain-containing protein n=1 Tax=Schistocephalus solidus TaxID=70667 RepID=A0A183TCX1_SCHSO